VILAAEPQSLPGPNGTIGAEFRPSLPVTTRLPPVLQPVKAVPPLITDINLSLTTVGSTSPPGGVGQIKRYDRRGR
jgi:hypothetical protein